MIAVALQERLPAGLPVVHDLAVLTIPDSRLKAWLISR